MPDLNPRETARRPCLPLVFFGLLLAGCGEGRLAPEPTHFETIISGPAGIELSGELFECFLLTSGQPLGLASTLLGVTDGTPERNRATTADSDIAEVLGVRLDLTKTAGEGVLQAEIQRNAELVSSGFASNLGDRIEISAGDPGRC
jgi:hypothetical protein